MSPKITFYHLGYFVRPGIPEVEGGDGVTVGVKRGKGQNVWSEQRQTHLKASKPATETVSVVTGQAHRRAERSAGSVQEDEGRHGSHTG